MGTEPLISLVIPNYRRASDLDFCLTYHRRELSQREVDFEIVVVDDASDDASSEVMETHRQDDPQGRVRTVSNPRNLGFRSNLLKAIRSARGRYTVYLGNDDLLIVDQVVAYVDWLEAEAGCNLLLAPWFAMNKTRRNEIMGASFSIDEPITLQRHAYRQALDVVLDKHIFPEWFIVRTAVAASIFQPFSPVGYHFFGHLARALHIGSVRVGSLPFAIVAAISKTEHVGTTETLFGWDEYRGGLELLASYAFVTMSRSERGAFEERIDAFETLRMRVALRLHLARRNWLDAWHLDRRLSARGVDALDSATRDELCSLAAIHALILEAQRAGYAEVVLADRVYAIAQSICKGMDIELVPESDFEPGEPRARAFVGFGTVPRPLEPGDLVLDAAEVLRAYGAQPTPQAASRRLAATA